MSTSLNEKFIAYFALLSGIVISAVAIFYSVSGLIAIYPSAVASIIVMGVAIEVGKLSMTLWLKQNWHAPWIYKITMIPAVIILMIITSGGVFGFLSKAHSDQSLVSGDALSKVQLIDDRILVVKDNIETQRANINAARTALQQLDNQVNARLDRGADEFSAERAVQIRRNQRTERANLNREITQAQDEIQMLNTELDVLNQEKAPLAGELRKVEAEVGPVKYIAALIYGDNPDANLLERAVRWVTLMIVIVLDPVAILLLLASQYSFQTIRQKKEAILEPIKPKEEYVEKKGNTEVFVEETTSTTQTSTSTFMPLESPITNILTEEVSIREPIKALPIEKPIDSKKEDPEETNLEFEDLLENTTDIDNTFIDELSESQDIELLSFEEEISLDISEIEISTKVSDNLNALDIKTADSTEILDLPKTEYVQNEEQQESNLWTSTSAVSSISQEAYLEKVRKLKGI
jgi:hypothetical protein